MDFMDEEAGCDEPDDDELSALVELEENERQKEGTFVANEEEEEEEEQGLSHAEVDRMREEREEAAIERKMASHGMAMPPPVPPHFSFSLCLISPVTVCVEQPGHQAWQRARV
jgi:hypothetical protein